MDHFGRRLDNGTQRHQVLIPETWKCSLVGKEDHMDVLKLGIWRWGDSVPGPSRCARMQPQASHLMRERQRELGHHTEEEGV